MNQQGFPPGWDDEGVQAVLDYYDDRAADELFGEFAVGAEATALVAVPTDLLSEVEALIATQRVD